MKKLFITLFFLLISTQINAADFIHPMDFKPTTQEDKVVKNIKDEVNRDYCIKLNMCDPMMVSMMEKENLKAFKELTKATNRSMLDRVIRDYCVKADMCNYTAILMTYQQNLKK